MSSYIFDTHVHTCETSPCGKVKAAALVKLYAKSGYDGIVITDHYFKGYFKSLGRKDWNRKIDIYLEGYKNALEEGNKLGLSVILGMEITFTENYNDYLVFGIDEEFLKQHKELFNLGLEKFRQLTIDKNILIFQAHPFRPEMIRADPRLLDGVEVYNGNLRHDSRNHLAYSFAEENNLMMLSGSDFHQIHDAARGGIEITENVQTSEGFVDLLKNYIYKVSRLIRTE